MQPSKQDTMRRIFWHFPIFWFWGYFEKFRNVFASAATSQKIILTTVLSKPPNWVPNINIIDRSRIFRPIHINVVHDNFLTILQTLFLEPLHSFLNNMQGIRDKKNYPNSEQKFVNGRLSWCWPLGSLRVANISPTFSIAKEQPSKTYYLQVYSEFPSHLLKLLLSNLEIGRHILWIWKRLYAWTFLNGRFSKVVTPDRNICAQIFSKK